VKSKNGFQKHYASGSYPGVNFIFQGGKFTETYIAANLNFYKSF